MCLVDGNNLASINSVMELFYLTQMAHVHTSKDTLLFEHYKKSVITEMLWFHVL